MRPVTRILCAAFSVMILTMGTFKANGAPGDLYASINGAPENGAGFIYRYTPDGVQTTFASGLSRPRGLAFDSAGNLFVANNFCGEAVCHPTILKITPSGVQKVFATLGPHFAQGVAIDGSDNVFVMTQNFGFTHSIIFKFTPDGMRMAFGFLPGPGSVQGFDLAFNSTGDLFAADPMQSTIYKFEPDGKRSVFVGPEAGVGPVGLAFDHFGNLFVSTEDFPFTNDTIFKFTPSGVRSTFATGRSSPRGLVFDRAGNLFVAEVSPLATGNIIKFTPDGILTVFASGIGDPQGNGGPEYLAMEP